MPAGLDKPRRLERERGVTDQREIKLGHDDTPND